MVVTIAHGVDVSAVTGRAERRVMSSRRLASLALAVVAATGGVLAAAPPAPAAPASPAVTRHEVYRVPPSGVFTLLGHGWGHGHGMSQYGAYGAAKERGLNYRQIVGFYYPHTTLVGQPMSTGVRVLLHDTASDRLTVAPAAGLRASTKAAGVPDCVLPASFDAGKTTVARWRALVVTVNGTTGIRLQHTNDGSTWGRGTPPGCDPGWGRVLPATVAFTG